MDTQKRVGASVDQLFSQFAPTVAVLGLGAVMITTPQTLNTWVAILFSNSPGTAFGDYLSDNIGLSYGMGAAVTGAIIVLVVLLHYYTTINRVLLFWVAFIFTRPFGATFGDLLTKPLAKGGLNFGRGLAALITAGLLFRVIYATQKQQNTGLKEG